MRVRVRVPVVLGAIEGRGGDEDDVGWPPGPA